MLDHRNGFAFLEQLAAFIAVEISGVTLSLTAGLAHTVKLCSGSMLDHRNGFAFFHQHIAVIAVRIAGVAFVITACFPGAIRFRIGHMGKHGNNIAISNLFRTKSTVDNAGESLTGTGCLLSTHGLARDVTLGRDYFTLDDHFAALGTNGISRVSISSACGILGIDQICRFMLTAATGQHKHKTKKRNCQNCFFHVCFPLILSGISFAAVQHANPHHYIIYYKKLLYFHYLLFKIP